MNAGGLHLRSTAILFLRKEKQLWLHSATHHGRLTKETAPGLLTRGPSVSSMPNMERAPVGDKTGTFLPGALRSRTHTFLDWQGAREPALGPSPYGLTVPTRVFFLNRRKPEMTERRAGNVRATHTTSLGLHPTGCLHPPMRARGSSSPASMTGVSLPNLYEEADGCAGWSAFHLGSRIQVSPFLLFFSDGCNKQEVCVFL